MAQRQTEPAWKGSREIKEQSNSPRWRYDQENFCIRVFEGPITALKSARPQRGSTMADLGQEGQDFTVRTIEIVPVDVSERGRMTIRLSDTSGRSSVEIIPPDPPHQDGDEVIEYGWLSIDKDIRYHPWFQDLTLQEREEIDEALGSNEPNTSEFSLRQEGLYEKLRRGQESYVLYAPVVSRVSYSLAQPNIAEVGQLTSPPGNVGGGWDWMKTNDGAVRRGGEGALWERREEWTGAEEWDPDIYPVPLG